MPLSRLVSITVTSGITRVAGVADLDGEGGGRRLRRGAAPATADEDAAASSGA